MLVSTSAYVCTRRFVLFHKLTFMDTFMNVFIRAAKIDARVYTNLSMCRYSHVMSQIGETLARLKFEVFKLQAILRF